VPAFNHSVEQGKAQQHNRAHGYGYNREAFVSHHRRAYSLIPLTHRTLVSLVSPFGCGFVAGGLAGVARSLGGAGPLQVYPAVPTQVFCAAGATATLAKAIVNLSRGIVNLSHPL